MTTVSMVFSSFSDTQVELFMRYSLLLLALSCFLGWSLQAPAPEKNTETTTAWSAVYNPYIPSDNTSTLPSIPEDQCLSEACMI